jgi:hypothetical protein
MLVNKFVFVPLCVIVAVKGTALPEGDCSITYCFGPHKSL